MNRALLVGINAYPGNELNGCINDVMDMADFLVSKCDFKHDEIRLLTDARATTLRIKRRLGWLLNGLRPGDRVLFHYSGHGAQVPTRNPQGEVDGLDEVICPVDFDWSDPNLIRDKDFKLIFSKIPEGVEFIWISDSCHSGDLTKAFRKHNDDRKIKIKTILPPADMNWRLLTAHKKNISAMTMEKACSALNLALISGCASAQTSADALINNRYNGALTRYLLNALISSGMTDSIKTIVESVNKSLDRDRYDQDPQLEGSKEVMKRAFLIPEKKFQLAGEIAEKKAK